MTTRTVLPSPSRLPALVPPPTGIEQAVVDDIVACHVPETFLWLNFPRTDGMPRIVYAWTPGGRPLGDHVDSLAVTAGMDTADWLHIADRHQQTTSRGRIEILAYPLRPVLADVQTDERAPRNRRDTISSYLQAAAGVPRQGTPHMRWFGFGPRLVQYLR